MQNRSTSSTPTKLPAKCSNAKSLDFVNTYKATGEVTFEGTKKIDTRDLTADDIFEFEVKEGTETIATVKNNATGKIEYPTIKYTLADVGTHTYTVKETSKDGKGITVSTQEYTVTVKVSDNKDGSLKVEPSSNAKSLDFSHSRSRKAARLLQKSKTMQPERSNIQRSITHLKTLEITYIPSKKLPRMTKASL